MVDAATIGSYLRERGFIPAGAAVTASARGGGVSNVVLLVEVDGLDPFIVKQARSRLDVDADWHIDPWRALNEASCLRHLATILPPGSVPSVLFEVPEDTLMATSVAPDGGEIWKAQLLAGEVSATTARRVGEMLAAIHARSAGDTAVRTRFDHPHLLEQGRIEPYHLTTAAAHPELAPVIEAEVRRLRATRRTLVLGDVSPKNIFVYPDSVFFFDVEIAHWGDPAFDAAFCLSHLVLKAVALPLHAAALLDAASAFWTAYAAGVPPWVGHDGHVVAELGCLLLARVDGKSPAEYLGDPEREAVRRLASALLLEPPRDPPECLSEARIQVAA